MSSNVSFSYSVSPKLQDSLNGVATMQPLAIGQMVVFMQNTYMVEEVIQIKVSVHSTSGCVYISHGSVILSAGSVLKTHLKTFGFSSLKEFTNHFFRGVKCDSERPFTFVYFNMFYNDSTFKRLWKST